MDPRWAHSPSNIKLRWSWGWAYDGRPDVEGIDTNNGESMYPKEKKKKKKLGYLESLSFLILGTDVVCLETGPDCWHWCRPDSPPWSCSSERLGRHFWLLPFSHTHIKTISQMDSASNSLFLLHCCHPDVGHSTTQASQQVSSCNSCLSQSLISTQ